MMTPGNQIFDLLLGSVPTGGLPAPSSASPVAPGFGDVLAGLLLGGEPAATGAIDALPFLSMQETPKDSGSKLRNYIATMQPSFAGNFPGSLGAIAADSPDDVVSKDSGVEQVPPATGPTVALPAWGRVDLAGLPIQGPITNQFLKDIINSVAKSIEPGVYRIAAASVNDGKLNLTLLDPNDGTSSIKVSLPVEAFQKAIGPALMNGLSAERVELNDPSNGANRLEKLFSELNLKELVVEKAPATKDPGQTADPRALGEAVVVTITAEGSGGEIAIRAKLSKSLLRASQVTDDLADGSTETIDLPEDVVRNTSGRVQLAGRKDISGLDKFTSVKPSKGAVEGGENVTGFTRQLNDPENAAALTGSPRHNAERGVSPEKIDVRPVRISFPENFASALKPNGRSVMLRIEPQHLGPARLTLVMRNDTLSARLIVESAVAKAAVERNLDGLVEKLAKADINVDSIEVEVSGNGGEGGLFDHRTLWSQRGRMAHSSAANGSDKDNTAAVPAVYVTPAMYIGAGGVNLLA